MRVARILFTTTLLCLAQQPGGSQSPTARTQVTGIVEAVIGSGDLKPARFAKIFAGPQQRSVDTKQALSMLSEAIERAHSQAKNREEDELVEIEYVKALIKLEPAFTALSGGGNIVATDADEDGEFTLQLPSNQPYTVFAEGRVGMNGAIWYLDVSTPGQANRLKLTKPVIACYDPKSFFKP